MHTYKKTDCILLSIKQTPEFIAFVLRIRIYYQKVDLLNSPKAHEYGII